MPELGAGGGPGLTGGLGDQLDAAEADPEKAQADQAELERLKALPPGHPDLEAAKKPEAEDAAVPEGPGSTGAAKSEGEGMGAEEQSAPNAELGAPADSPPVEYAGKGVEMVQEDVPIPPPMTGPAAQGVSNAQSEPPQAQQPAEAKAEAAVEPGGGESGPGTGEELSIDNAEAPALDVPAPAETPAPDAAQVEGKPETIEADGGGDPAAEGMAGAEPEQAPEAADEPVAAPAADAPAGAEMMAPEAQIEPAAEGGEIAVADAGEAQVTEEGTPELAVEEEAVAEESVVEDLPVDGDTAPEEVPAEAAEEQAVAGEETVDQVEEGAVEDAPEEAVAEAPAAQLAVDEAVEAVPEGGEAPAPAGEEIRADDGGAPATLEGGGVSTELAADVPGPVGEVAVREEAAPTPEGEGGQAPEAAGADVSTAAGELGNDESGGAPEEVQDDGSSEEVIEVAEPDMPTLPGTDSAVQLEDATPTGGDPDDFLGGMEAAQQTGEQVLGAAAEGAAELANLPPPGQAPDAVDAANKVADVAGKDPNLAADEKESAEDKGDDAEVPVTDLARVAGEAGKAVQGGMDEVADQKKKLQQLDQLHANPAERVQDLLGEGENPVGSIRSKAEQALDVNLSDVKIHKGAGARETATAMDAAAFTFDDQIVMGKAQDYGAAKQDLVLAEEFVHVAQMRKGAAKGARAGISKGADRAEKAAQQAAQRIMDGARNLSIGHDEERRAIYRNDGNEGSTSAASYPDRVTVMLGGRNVTANLPVLEAGTRSKMVNLPSMDIPGLNLNSNATFNFDPDTGEFKGGRTSAAIVVGDVLRLEDAVVNISKSGQMTSSFSGVGLTVGGLMQSEIDTSIGPQGVSASGTFQYSELKGDQLANWLTGGTMTVNVDSNANVSGTGSLDIQLGDFSQGKISASIASNKLQGSINIKQTQVINIGSAATVSAGTLTGALKDSNQASVKGNLELDVAPLAGKGRVEAAWESKTKKISGKASLSFEEEVGLGPVSITKATLTGTVKDSKLVRLDGSGQAAYDALFEGSWKGGIDIEKSKVDFVLAGQLKVPITQGDAEISKGSLTVQVDQNKLTKTAGKVAFKLSDFLKGTAVMEAGTTADNINATATAAVVGTQTYGDVKISKGAATVKVRGTAVELVSGHVDLAYKDIATGQLNLTRSDNYKKFSGAAKATLKPNLTWNDILVQSGHVAIDLEKNAVKSARGSAKFKYTPHYAGSIDFDAKQNFDTIKGTATGYVAQQKNFGNLKLLADTATTFTMKFNNSRFQSFKGGLKWEYGQFAGSINVTADTTDFASFTGKGKADIKKAFRISDVSGVPLMAQPGSSLSAKFEGGSFTGVKGQLKWQYSNWLGGNFKIDSYTGSIDSIDGTLDAKVIAPHGITSKVKVLPSQGGDALKVKITDSRPTQYAGRLRFEYQKFLQGSVAVTGEALNFDNLSGKAGVKVVAKKNLGSGFFLRPGGSLDVTFANSAFTNFKGTALFGYQAWLEGSAKASANSSVSAGIEGEATATLKANPPALNTSDLKLEAGGTAKLMLAPSTAISEFKAQTHVNWNYQKWLKGDLKLTANSAMASLSGEASAQVVGNKVLNKQPKLEMLPTAGLKVKFSGGQTTQFSGKASVKIEDWAQGTLNIAPNSTATLFYGDLNGKLLRNRKVPSTELTLTAGGAVDVKVSQNQPTSIKGTIPFKYGATGKEWLGGKVVANASTGLDAITGSVTARLIARKELAGGFALLKGGNVNVQMTNSHIDKLAGTVNWEHKAGTAGVWIKGNVTLKEGSTPTSISGSISASLTGKKDIGNNVVLKASSGITGEIENGNVKKIGGSINWEYDKWLSGTVKVTAPSVPHQLTGIATAGLKAGTKKAVIPDKLFITDGAKFKVGFTAGAVGEYSGNIPFLYENWIKGSVSVTGGSASNISGTAKASIVKNKLFAEGTAFQVKLLPGGNLNNVTIDRNGVKDISGTVSAELGTPATDGTKLHVRGKATPKLATLSAYKGGLQGALISPKKIGPSLTLEKGGSFKVGLEGISVKSMGGKVAYTFAPGGVPFIAGQIKITDGSTMTSISGSITGSIAKQLKFGDKLTVLKGGSVAGSITNNNTVKVGGNFSFKYDTFLKGNLKIAGQVDPYQPKVSGEASASLIKKVDIGGTPLVSLKSGSSVGAEVKDSKVTKFYGNVGLTIGKDFDGSVKISKGMSTVDSITDSAKVRLINHKQIGSSTLYLLKNSTVSADLVENKLAGFEGKIDWKYDKFLKGNVTVEGGSSLDSVSGTGSARFVDDLPIAGSELTIRKGSSGTAKIVGSNLDSVGGKLLWFYGADKWLTGDITVPPGTDVKTPSGTATARLNVNKPLGGDFMLNKGGSLKAEFAAGKVTSFSGKILWSYGADQWLKGSVTIDPASDLKKISGVAKGTIAKQVQVGSSDLHLLKGGSLSLKVTNNVPSKFDGKVSWLYSDWLTGSVSVTAGDKDNIKGEATATLKGPYDIPGTELQLQKGGSAKVTLDGKAIKEFGGTVNWKYGGADPWAKGSLTVAGKSSFNAISGKASAQLIKDLKFPDQKLTIVGGKSSLQATFAASALKTFGGSLGFKYGAGDWLQGTVTANPDSTVKGVSGKASASVKSAYTVPGTTFVIQTGSTAQVDMTKSAVSGLSGNLNWVYGEGGWLKGAIKVNKGSTPDKISGSVTASLATTKFVDGTEVRFLKGGSIKASFDGAKIDSFSGKVSMMYEDWLGGSVTIGQGSTFESIDGDVQASLKRNKQITSDFVLSRGGSAKVNFAASKFQSFSGKLDWKYQNWLKGSITVDPGSNDKSISGTASATLAQRKMVGDKLQLGKGSTLKAKFTDSKLEGFGGDVAWTYDGWIAGTVKVPNYSKIDAISGTATAALKQNKQVTGDLMLKRGGSVKVVLNKGNIDKIQGKVSWKYQDWLGGALTLDPSTLDHFKGKGSATMIRSKAIGGSGLKVNRGGKVNIGFDSAADLASQKIDGKLSIDYKKLVRATAIVDTGSTLGSVSGKATGKLLSEQSVGGVLTVKAGGNVRVKVANSAPESFGGDIAFGYDKWLSGTVSIKDGSQLDKISGKATARIDKEHSPGGGDFALRPGGSAEINLQSNKVTTFGGNVSWKYSNWLKGEAKVATTSTLESIQAEASATITQPKQIGGSQLKVKAGSTAKVWLAKSDFEALAGSIGWQYSTWAEGKITVKKSKLDKLSGDAEARIVGEKVIAGKLSATPGGQGKVTIAEGGLKKWSGKLNVKYGSQISGSLAISGGTTLETVKGKIEGRLLEDLKLAKDVSILSGSTANATFESADLKTFGGKVRFKYSKWLQGSITVEDNSTLKAIHGEAKASLVAPYAPGGGNFELQKGGSLTTTFKNSAFDTIGGKVQWKYKAGKAKLTGSITIDKSPIDSISGNAKARLMSDTEAAGGIKLLRGGNLTVNVAASQPKSIGGRVNWQYQNWLKGHVAVANNTPIDGPYKGTASARLIDNKPLGGKFSLKKGGDLKLKLDTAAGLDNTIFSGHLAVDYDSWLRGTLWMDPSTLKSLSGKAKVQLWAGKSFGNVKLLRWSQLNAKFQNSALTNFGGMVKWRYENWLEGSLNVKDSSTPKSISGDASANLKVEKTWGPFTMKAGGGLKVGIDNNELGKFGGNVGFTYNKWISGNLEIDGNSTKDAISGKGSAKLEQTKSPAGPLSLEKGGNLMVGVKKSAVDQFGGEINITYENWAKGSLKIQGQGTLDSLSGVAQIRLTKDKKVRSVRLKEGSGAEAGIQSSSLKTLAGSLKFDFMDTVEGKMNLSTGSTPDKVGGDVQVSVMKNIPLIAKLELQKGGNIKGVIADNKLDQLTGQVSLMYDTWLKGTATMQTGSNLEKFIGDATLSVEQKKTFKGGIAIDQGSFLKVGFDASGPKSYEGNIDVAYENWIKGNLNFKATSLDDISGSGSVEVMKKKQLVNPVSLLPGSYLRINFENSKLKDFAGSAKLEVAKWGKGTLTVNEGSTTKSVSGEGKVELGQPKKLGSYVTLTKAMIGATIENNDLKSIYGEAEATVKDMGKGWVRVDKQSTLTSFYGQAGLALTKPQPIGSFAELSGGEVLANFEANALKSFGGWAEIKVFGWGKGKVTVDQGSTMDHIKGSASLSLTEPKSLAGGRVKITGGKVSASVDGQKLTRIAGMVEAELTGIAKGKIEGELDVQKEMFSGSGMVEQIKPWNAGPVKISDGKLSAVITENKLTGASGSAKLDAGRFGKGSVEINYEDNGSGPIFYGKGDVEFQPHDRVKGKLEVALSREQKLTGKGTVTVKISDQISGEASVALDEQGHVLLSGAVTIPGPYELFKADPYKKDITLLDLSFVVYAPPVVAVNVGAGIGLEAGIKPLVISNIVLSGQCDLMEPEFASMAVTAHLSSSAYVDLNAYIEGSVSVSAAVVKVEAGLRAALNLHLEAALEADPTITVNRNGLSFDMPVNAQLSAALSLVLSFFAKVKVGIDVGLFSIMKTVWRHDAEAARLQLAAMSIGARGQVHAGADGFSASMNPEYEAPDLSLDSLKRAIGL